MIHLPLLTRGLLTPQTSNIMHLEARPFDPVTFEKEEEAYEDEVTGEVKVRLRDESTIRWRIVPDGEGAMWRMRPVVERAVMLVFACHVVAHVRRCPPHTNIRMTGQCRDLL